MSNLINFFFITYAVFFFRSVEVSYCLTVQLPGDLRTFYSDFLSRLASMVLLCVGAWGEGVIYAVTCYSSCTPHVCSRLYTLNYSIFFLFFALFFGFYVLYMFFFLQFFNILLSTI